MLQNKSDLHGLTFVFLIAPLLLVVGADTISEPRMSNSWFSGVLIAFTMLSIVLLFLSARKIEANEVGVILFSGKPLFEVKSGLVFVLPFFDLRKHNCNQCELRFPQENENPIRITHGVSKSPTTDPLDSRLTTSVSLILIYQLNDYLAYITTAPEIEEFNRQIKGALIYAASVECATFPLSINLTKERRDEINYKLSEEMEKFTKKWGITIVSAQLHGIDLGNEIDIAQKNLSVSAINTGVDRNNAQKILYNGMSEAKVHEAFLFAKAEGLNELANKLGISEKELVLQLNTVESIFRKSHGDLNMYGGNFQQLANMVFSAFRASGGNTNAIDQN